MKSKKPAQWGPDKPPTVLHPGFDHEVGSAVIQQGLHRYIGEAVEHGFRIVHTMPTKAVLERPHAPGNAARRAGVGFLLFGFIGAAVGAGTSADARVERIRIWADSHGAIYVKSI